MIVVALSGGVDSATVAGLLVEAGHRVVGVSMRLYDARGTRRRWAGAAAGRATRGCSQGGRAPRDPVLRGNYEEQFSARVVDDFVSEYARGPHAQSVRAL